MISICLWFFVKLAELEITTKLLPQNYRPSLISFGSKQNICVGLFRFADIEDLKHIFTHKILFKNHGL